MCEDHIFYNVEDAVNAIAAALQKQPNLNITSRMSGGYIILTFWKREGEATAL